MTREGEHTEVIDQRARGQIQTDRARARRSVVAVAMFLGALTVPVLAATPAMASPYTCAGTNDPICQALTPTFNCVWHDTAGNWTAVFGYQNVSPTYDITVPVGSLNSMSSGDGRQST